MLKARTVRLRTRIAGPQPRHRLPCVDRRPPTADRRPPTADRRPPTADRRPPSCHSAGAAFWASGCSFLAGATLLPVRRDVLHVRGPAGMAGSCIARPASPNHTAASAEPCPLCRARPRQCARRPRVLATRAQCLGQSCSLATFRRGALPDRESLWMAVGALFVRKPESHGRKR
ncbi:hypothetical protein B9W68_10220 [Streptomyces sp. CS227]|nr:hypothetical protein B9W68_10220 [Streptomyces sp. CS227]